MGGYVELDGITTWYDTWGSGSPVVLLHGGFGSNLEWEVHAPALAEHLAVFAPERRGHGRTQDAGPISYALMADDTIAFLERVVGVPAHLVGWSDGGIVALLVAYRRPELVSKIVPVSANFQATGALPEFLAASTSITADDPSFEPLRSMYASLSPDGAEHWPVVFEKIKTMILTESILDTDQLGEIVAPALVLSGDDDMITLEHTIELYRSLRDAQLGVVPGTTHFLLMERAELVGGMIRDFLLNDPTPTMMPFRRAHAAG